MEPYEQFYEGTVGDRPVGFRFVVNRQQPKSSTYYVGPDWREQPLRVVEQRPGKLVLQAEDGSLFNLSFYYNETTPADDFYDSIGLRGTVNGRNGALPVNISGEWSRQHDIGGRLYEDVAKQDDVLEKSAQTFLTGVLADRPNDAAKAISYPMTVEWCSITIRNKTQLVSYWHSIFTPAFKAKLKLAVPHNMFVDPKSENAMVLNGLVWFDEKGATDVRPGKCPARRKRKSAPRL